MTEKIPDDMTELVDARIDRVDLVGKAANGTRFILAKGAEAPAMLNADDMRAVLANIAKDEADDLGDKPDAVDLTEVLAEPDTTAPGDENQPGSPAWEATDAATAQKWTGVLGRVKNALQVMADREGVEAASPGGDGDDMDNQWNLEDACSAVDYAISVLAPFAVAEAQGSQLAAEAAATLIGKAVDEMAPSLGTVEGLGVIRKAGRALSAANENALRNAADAIQKVLASLPPAPEDVPVQKEAALAEEVTPTPVEPVTKADDVSGLVAVFDANGKLVGVTDPTNIQPVAGASTTDPADTPAEPAAEVIPGTETVQSPAAEPATDDTQNVTKSTTDIVQMLKEALDPIAKQLSENEKLADVVKNLQERIEMFGREPDDRRSPLLNGGTGTAGIAKRDAGDVDTFAVLRKAVDDATNPGARLAAQKSLGYAAIRDRLTSH